MGRQAYIVSSVGSAVYIYSIKAQGVRRLVTYVRDC